MVASELTLSSDESQTLFPDPSRTPRIALGMIVKDEETTLRKTLDSAIDAVEAIFIFDTGSTDGTLDLIREYRKEIAPKPIYLMQGEFVNFSVSRNKLLDFIENHQSSHFIDFILLLDANDEFHGVKELKEYASQRLASPDDDEGGFYILQKWLYGDVIEKYYNIFLIRPRKEWRYSGVVTNTSTLRISNLPRNPTDAPTLSTFTRTVMKIVSSHLSAITVTRNCCWVNWNAFLMILELCSIWLRHVTVLNFMTKHMITTRGVKPFAKMALCLKKRTTASIV